jgi:hypothetical protein
MDTVSPYQATANTAVAQVWCTGCRQYKDPNLFTPGQLNRKKPKCRKCRGKERSEGRHPDLPSVPKPP